VSAQSRVPYAAGVYLAAVQFFFAATWTIYVLFLPALAASVGIPADRVVWILMLDQAIFAIMDTATGMAADRVGRLLGRLGGPILAVTAVSCGSFLLIPQVAQAGAEVQGVLFASMALWAATSSCLRAPPWVLLVKYAAAPSLPSLAALSVVGVSLAGAVAPYLGVALRNQDPRLPFALSSAALLATVGGLVLVERALVGASAPEADGEPLQQPATDRSGRTPLLALFLVGAVVLAAGYQAYVSFNASKQFLKFVTPEDLQLLTPIFWIGFNLLTFPVAGLAARRGGLAVMAWSAVLGAAATAAAGIAPSLELTILAQFVAGGAWGSVLMAGLSAALGLGRTGHEGSTLGLWFSVQAVAAFVRLAIVAAQLDRAPGMADVLAWAPPLLWTGGGVLLVCAVLWARGRARLYLVAP
jgi:hypothetical protein